MNLELENLTYVHPETGIIINEEWKDIDGFLDLYCISNLGRVLSFKGVVPRILRPRNHKKGYLAVRLFGESGNPKKAKNHLVHKLVADHFLIQPEGIKNPTTNHIDGDKKNNVISNLEIISHQANIQHSVDTGLRKFKYGKDHHSTDQRTYKFYNTKTKAYFQGLRVELANKFSLCPGNLSLMVRGKKPSAYGWIITA